MSQWPAVDSDLVNRLWRYYSRIAEETDKYMAKNSKPKYKYSVFFRDQNMMQSCLLKAFLGYESIADPCQRESFARHITVLNASSDSKSDFEIKQIVIEKLMAIQSEDPNKSVLLVLPDYALFEEPELRQINHSLDNICFKWTCINRNSFYRTHDKMCDYVIMPDCSSTHANLLVGLVAMSKATRLLILIDSSSESVIDSAAINIAERTVNNRMKSHELKNLPAHYRISPSKSFIEYCIDIIFLRSTDFLRYYMFTDFIGNKCFNIVKDFYGDPDQYNKGQYEPKSLLGYVNGLSAREKNHYEALETDALYYCRYGLAYAVEYYLYYHILLKLYKRDEMRVLSLGCGNCLDAWSLAYARAKLYEEGVNVPKRIYYDGMDYKDWELKIIGNCSDTDDASIRKYMPGFSMQVVTGPEQGNISNIKSSNLLSVRDGALTADVLIFPKILNELNYETRKSFLDELRTLKFTKNTYYIIAVYSPYYATTGQNDQVASDSKYMCEILSVFNRKGYVVECCDVDHELTEVLYPVHEFKRTNFGPYQVGHSYDCSGEATISPKFEELSDSEFSYNSTTKSGMEELKNVENYLRKLQAKSSKAIQMTRWVNIKFNIFKLTRKSTKI